MPTNHPTSISTITPTASVTPQVSRKSAKNMNKKELEVEVNRLRGKEGLYESSLNELRDELKSLKSTMHELKKEREQYKSSRGLHKRVIDLEKLTAEHEQYSRRECVELVGLPENTNSKDLEDLVVEAFEVAGVKVKKRSFTQFIALQITKSPLLNLLTEEMSSAYSETKNINSYNSMNATKINSNQQKYTWMNLFAHTVANCLENVIAS